MVAELPGAATVEAMSRPEQEKAEKVFEEARGEASSQSELMAGGQGPLVSGQVPYSQLFVPNGIQAISFLPVGGQVTNSGYVLAGCDPVVMLSPEVLVQVFGRSHQRRWRRSTWTRRLTWEAR